MNSKPNLAMNIHTRTQRFTAFALGLTLMFGIQAKAAEAGSDQPLVARISNASVFYQDLRWLGQTPPAPAENALLWSIIEKMRKEGTRPSLPALEEFVATYTNSPWLPALRANLARYYS